MQTFKITFVILLCLLSGFGIDTIAQTRIMPLGNSLTAGDYPNGQHSYRGHLRKRLLDNGYTNIDFVGDQSGPCGHGDNSPCDPDHSGHGGYTIGPDTQKWCETCETTGVYEHVIGWLNTANPDMILVEIGINDFFNEGGHPANYNSTAPDRYQNLITRITSTKPNAKVFIATLTPVKWDVNWSNGWLPYNLNQKIAAIASASSSDNIYFVDMYNKMSATFSSADYWDDVHFAEQGAKKMAGIWYDAITPHLSKSTIPPSSGSFSGTYEIKAKHSGKALDVSGSSTADGAKVQQWTDNDTNAQRWIITSVGDGYYKLICKASGKALDVSGVSYDNGAKVHQWTYGGGDNQKWKIESTGDGYYSITAKHSGKALDVSDVSYSDGAQIHQWDNYKSDNQKWQLTQTSTSTSESTTEEIEEISLSGNLNIYPVPASDKFTISFQSKIDQKIKLTLIDHLSRTVAEVTHHVKVGANEISLNTTKMPNGMYFINLPVNGESVVRKILIAK